MTYIDLIRSILQDAVVPNGLSLAPLMSLLTHMDLICYSTSSCPLRVGPKRSGVVSLDLFMIVKINAKLIRISGIPGYSERDGLICLDSVIYIEFIVW